jgi:hypothetical protein
MAFGQRLRQGRPLHDLDMTGQSEQCMTEQCMVEWLLAWQVMTDLQHGLDGIIRYHTPRPHFTAICWVTRLAATP